jgi:hypothetical protein
MNNELRRQFSGMNDTDFADAKAAMKAAEDDRRAKITLESIRPGMKPEDMARTRAEILRLVSGGQ